MGGQGPNFLGWQQKRQLGGLWFGFEQESLDELPSLCAVKRLRCKPVMGIVITLVAVASMASRHDVAEVMLAAFADRHNVFNLQISSRTAIGAGVIELPPPSQEVGGGQVMGGAITLRHLALGHHINAQRRRRVQGLYAGIR